MPDPERIRYLKSKGIIYLITLTNQLLTSSSR